MITRNFGPLSRALFIRWLNSHEGRTVGAGMDSNRCPLANYLVDYHLDPDVIVNPLEGTYQVCSEVFPLRQWAREFAFSVDRMHPKGGRVHWEEAVGILINDGHNVRGLRVPSRWPVCEVAS